MNLQTSITATNSMARTRTLHMGTMKHFFFFYEPKIVSFGECRCIFEKSTKKIFFELRFTKSYLS